jgi:hypothetical protein
MGTFMADSQRPAAPQARSRTSPSLPSAAPSRTRGWWRPAAGPRRHLAAGRATLYSCLWVKGYRLWSKLRVGGNGATPARAQLRPTAVFFYLRQRYGPSLKQYTACAYHAFGIIGTALSQKIRVFQPSPPKVAPRRVQARASSRCGWWARCSASPSAWSRQPRAVEPFRRRFVYFVWGPANEIHTKRRPQT